MRECIWIAFGSFIFSFFSMSKFNSNLWGKAKELLPRGFPKSQMVSMNPADIDNRYLEIDSLDQFGTMGSTNILIDIKTG
jgi:hypothetical protein